jgi:hypothetical protein
VNFKTNHSFVFRDEFCRGKKNIGGHGGHKFTG